MLAEAQSTRELLSRKSATTFRGGAVVRPVRANGSVSSNKPSTSRVLSLAPRILATGKHLILQHQIGSREQQTKFGKISMGGMVLASWLDIGKIIF